MEERTLLQSWSKPETTFLGVRMLNDGVAEEYELVVHLCLYWFVVVALPRSRIDRSYLLQTGDGSCENGGSGYAS